MSQHLMSVFSAEGAPIQLTAGYDPRLRVFFLSLRDKRLPAPDADEPAPAGLADALSYDSLSECVGFRSIGDVEARLMEYGIPFDAETEPGAERNPQLLKLLVEIMLEKEHDDPTCGRKQKSWDVAAAA